MENRFAIGVMYYGGAFNGQPGFFTQPSGPGTPVFPTQQNAASWPEYPIPGLVIQEYSPWWSPGCGHSIKTWKVIQEWDYDNDTSVALITCEVCSYCQAVYRPFEAWLDPIQHAIVVA